MDNLYTYDCAIVGGGIGGLCLSIQLAQLGHSVIVIEKNSYPFHKVCGEYVSNESLNFFMQLGLPLSSWKLPQIRSIGISSEKGFMMNAKLPMGGFGISRYKLDYELYQLAKLSGVTVLTSIQVMGANAELLLTNKGHYRAKIMVGAFGKYNPQFLKTKERPAENYVGVKYHITTDFREDRIELHNFENGYCGISKIEDDKYCLCYLSHVSNLKRCNNSIKEMEEYILKRNPYLQTIFKNSAFVFKTPVTISNIKFEARKPHDSNMLYLGDAAGCISPLTGNGMSMAAYTSVLLTGLINSHLQHKITKDELYVKYKGLWEQHFSKRIRRGKQLQYLFGKRHLSDLVLRLLDPFETIKSSIIKSTHGEQF